MFGSAAIRLGIGTRSSFDFYCKYRKFTIDTGRKEGELQYPFGGGAGSNAMWPGLSCTSVPSGIFIHPAVWPQ